MKKIIITVVALVVLLPNMLQAQHYRTDFSSKDYVDTMATMVWTGINMSGQIPLGGTLREWFKPNLSMGAGFTVKTKKNWTFDVGFNYMFGGNLRDTSFAFLGDVVDEDGRIMDGNGMKATIYTEGRYWYFGGGVGKVFPVNRWQNSGIWLRLNAGYFGHKIRINDYDNQVPQLDDDYNKGYDHRSGGFAMNQFIGYLFIQKNRILNFYGGIEFFETWTKPNRNYIINEGPTANMPYKFSGLIGLKIGWNIPLYEKKTVTTFYYK
ncbi:MAG: hypothetical protein MJZ39_00800 [Bacteroidales bacterium]|nr:hypothetical protein [Bacteroidales bacterium]